jgi:hypothetical protein
MAQLLASLRNYFVQLEAVRHINIASLNINTDTLPTTDANKRLGDVWVDGNILKVAGLAGGGSTTETIVRHGFKVEDGAWEVTLSYNNSTRVVTVTPTGASFDVWVNGTKFTKTGAQTAPAHAATTGGYFISYDSTGALVTSSSPWSLTDAQATPVAYVYYNSALADGVCFFECHTYERSRALHANLHFTQGTKVVSGLAASGYTLNTDTNAAVTMAFASGVVADEDIFRTLSGVADGGPYVLWHRATTSGEWRWTTGSYPFFYSTYPQYNYDAGGGTGWTLADVNGVGAGEYVNYWVFASTAVAANGQVFIVPGQQKFTTQQAAEAESLADIAWGTMPFQEIAPLYRLTLWGMVGFGGTTKTELVAITRLLGGGASIISSASPSSHNSLSGRSDAGAHPASAITNTPAGNIAATTVQAAINELDSEKASVNINKIQALGSVSGNVSVNLTLGQIATATCTGACTWSFTNLTTGEVNNLTLVLTNPGLGTQTFPSGTVFDRNAAPTLPAAGVTALMFETYDNGTNWAAAQVWRNVA